MKLNPDNFKPMHIILAVGGFFLAGLMFISQGAAKSPVYQPITPQAQTSYTAAQESLCEAEKTLSQAKLMDFVNNSLKLDPQAVANLAIKRDQACDFTK